MAEQQVSGDGEAPPPPPPPPPPPSQPQTPSYKSVKEEMIECVTALEAALLPCLPARELQAVDRSTHPSHQSVVLPGTLSDSSIDHVDVERHARDFMEAAKKLDLYFLGLQREDRPSKAELLKKNIEAMEEELKAKTELIKKQDELIQGWRKELQDQLEKHKAELHKV